MKICKERFDENANYFEKQIDDPIIVPENTSDYEEMHRRMKKFNEETKDVYAMSNVCCQARNLIISTKMNISVCKLTSKSSIYNGLQLDNGNIIELHIQDCHNHEKIGKYLKKLVLALSSHL